MNGYSPPAYLPWIPGFVVTLGDRFDSTGAQDLDPADQSGLNVSLDKFLGIQLALNSHLLFSLILKSGDTLQAVTSSIRWNGYNWKH